jgi:aspartyl protease family protein
MVRILTIVALVVAAALIFPKVAPNLLAGLSENGTPEEIAAPAMTADQPAPAQPSLTPRRVALNADPRGHFLADAAVNGRSIAMMVDTGATIVAINDATARRLGIAPAASEYVVPISTANGIVKAAPVMLSEVRLGGITVRNVQAVVVPGKALETNLLGMSFLGRLSSFQVAANRLILVE